MHRTWTFKSVFHPLNDKWWQESEGAWIAEGKMESRLEFICGEYQITLRNLAITLQAMGNHMSLISPVWWQKWGDTNSYMKICILGRIFREHCRKWTEAGEAGRVTI